MEAAAQARRAPLAGLLVVAAGGVLLFHRGLASWFALDDFLWLHVARLAPERGAWTTLGTATLHGTWRPLSEPGFFTACYRLFGLHALPYRALVFATYAGDVVLVGALAARLGATRAWSLAAAALFAVHSGLLVPMCWTSSYNQVLTIGLIAGELIVWLDWCERGGRCRYAALLALYALSLLALEVNVVFPAIAACALGALEPRRRWRELSLALAPLCALAAAWAAIHLVHAPAAQRGIYQLRFGWINVVVLWRYWRWTVLPAQLWEDQAWRSIVPAIAGALAIGGVAWRARRGDRRPLLLLVTYAMTFGPSLLLPAHIDSAPNVVATPAFAFALAFASLLAPLARAGRAGRAAALGLAGGFAGVMIYGSAIGCREWSERTRTVEPIIRRVMAARAAAPERPIRVRGADDDFLSYAGEDNAFDALGLDAVCVELTPEARAGHRLPRWLPCGAPTADALSLDVAERAP